ARLETIDMLRKIQREKGAVSVVPIEDMVILQEDRELLTLVEQEFSEETEQILNCLSSKDRELFRRIFVEEQEPETAGCAMGMSRDNVYVRIFRGKKKIRRKMQSWKGTKVV
ncbi:MAG: RNA polymerase subunit sigma-70, partial [Lachnospiraceae bacterium]|nr:RNA polymerase subunit sigma-70 [Lachnospiraceae bacterium]